MNAIEQPEFDIDLRILNIWAEVEELPESLSQYASMLRAAYGKGYWDALKEPERGQMCRDHGYPIPERKCS